MNLFFVIILFFDPFVVPISYAVSIPSITFQEISPISEVDNVILKCNEQIDLANYMVTDLDGTDSFLSESSLICSQNQLVKVFWEDGENIIEGEVIKLFIFDTALTNTKDQIVIKNELEEIIDGVVYWDGESTFDSASELQDIESMVVAEVWDGVESGSAVIVQSDQVFERKNYNYNKDDWSLKQENSSSSSMSSVESSSSVNSSQNISSDSGQEYIDGVIIYEVMPNPVGSDTENEYIILKNTTSNKIDISNWILRDEVKDYVIPEDNYLLSGGLITFIRPETGISLNNSDETLKLLFPDGEVTHVFSYDDSDEGVVLYFENGEVVSRVNSSANESSFSSSSSVVSESIYSSIASSVSVSASIIVIPVESSKKTIVSREVFSPQGKTVWVRYSSSSVKNGRLEAYIVGVFADGEKEDHLVLFNPLKKDINLYDYKLFINEKENGISHIKIPSMSYVQIYIDIPNTNGNIFLENNNAQQEIIYEKSKKDMYYIFDKSLGVWDWQKNYVQIKSLPISSKARRIPSKNVQVVVPVALASDPLEKISYDVSTENNISEKVVLAVSSSSSEQYNPYEYLYEGDEFEGKISSNNTIWYVFSIVLLFVVIVFGGLFLKKYGFKFLLENETVNSEKTNENVEKDVVVVKSIPDEEKSLHIIDVSNFHQKCYNTSQF